MPLASLDSDSLDELKELAKYANRVLSEEIDPTDANTAIILAEKVVKTLTSIIWLYDKN